jgi:sulfur-carrier protein adenylyltransferase/sulfurtransferase
MRYQRQIVLPQVKPEGQKAIGQARVLLVGAGGLGTPAAQYLVAAGIGHLKIFDGDLVEASNLHRQTQFDQSDCGKNKATVLGARLQRLNPDCVIECYPFFLDKRLAYEHFSSADVIIDGTDNFASKYLVNDMAAMFSKPVIFGAISQFEGQVSVFWQGHGPCYRCLFPSPPKTTIQNCAEAGVLGPLPGIIGSMQAMECLKVILYQRDNKSVNPLLGRIVTFDFAHNSFHSYKVLKDPRCPCASSGYQLENIQDIEMKSCLMPDDERLHAFSEVPGSGDSRIIDVRTQSEWDEFHLSGSIHWPFHRMVNGEYPQLSEDVDYFCVCLSSSRAKKAKEILRDHGFSNVNYLTGSIYEYAP